MLLLERNYRFSMEITQSCLLDGSCHTGESIKAYIEHGFTWERPLPVIMIELIVGLMGSDKNLMGGVCSNHLA